MDESGDEASRSLSLQVGRVYGEASQSGYTPLVGGRAPPPGKFDADAFSCACFQLSALRRYR